MSFPIPLHPARTLAAISALALLAACSEPWDSDLRGNVGGFSTANAARGITSDRPRPDDRGLITYPNYQVAVARNGDSVADVANRVGVPAGEMARFNGVEPDVKLRAGEILALPHKVAVAPGGSGVDIAALAGSAIDSAPDTSPVTTTTLEPAAQTVVTPAPAVGPEPVRHKVKRGETAYTISRLYQVPVKSLGEWNGLGPDFSIREGQYLLIPVTNAPPPAAAPVGVTQPGSGSPTPTPPSATTPLPDEKVAPKTPVPASASVGTPSRSTSKAAMAYPVQGKVIRAYSKGRNDGIDIAAAPGTAVTAADNGSVAAITSSADQVPIVVVRHADNVLTVYANVDNIAVKKGDPVKRGQKLAQLRDGDNAYVHFEVRNGFDSVDPTPYLE